MKIVLIVLAVLVGVVVLMYLIGLVLPRNHSATSAASYQASREELWKAITDWRSIPEWRREVTAVKELRDEQGREGWIETTRLGTMPMVIERSEPPRLFAGRIADDRLPFGGTWTWRLEPTATGTRVSITEDGEVKPPLFRFMSKFLFGHHRTMNGYLAALGRRFGETVEPRRQS